MNAIPATTPAEVDLSRHDPRFVIREDASGVHLVDQDGVFQLNAAYEFRDDAIQLRDLLNQYQSVVNEFIHAILDPWDGST